MYYRRNPAAKPHRIRYEFKEFYINGKKHRWAATYCCELKKWLFDLSREHPTVKGHLQCVSGVEITTRELFSMHEIKSIEVTGRVCLIKSTLLDVMVTEIIHTKGWHFYDRDGFQYWL